VQRVAILTHARKDIEARAMQVDWGIGLLHIQELYDTAFSKIDPIHLADYIRDNVPVCQGCMQGVMFVAGIFHSKAYRGDFRFLSGFAEVDAIRKFNTKVFGVDATYAECAFEGNSVYAKDKDGQITDEGCEAAHAFRHVASPTKRALSIIDRMIENGGTFFPQE